MSQDSAEPPPDEMRCLGSRVVFESRWMRLREDSIEHQDGTRALYGVVEKTDFVTILALGQGRLHLVNQYRYPVKSRQWELPQGAWEADPDRPLEQVARAELREETGLEAEQLEEIGQLFLAYGFCTQRYKVFLATGLSQHEPRREASEAGMISGSFEVAEVLRMITSGEIADATTVAAVGLARLKGRL